MYAFQGIDHDMDIGDDVWKLKNEPECLFSRLKTVDLHQFRGVKTEINLLHLVVKYASVLERINVHCLLQNLNKRNEIFKPLLMLEGGKRICSVVYL